MQRKFLIFIAGAGLFLSATGCRHNNTKNPLANLDSKQPDKVLFDRAMEALKKSRFDVARITLQTLINTYPDSEYIARAKLAVGDSWYAEGGTAAYAQAEAEYKDFITFFPKMPEAAEAQLKVANIHYRQLEKTDRDYTHAKRAEDEYRELIQQFPDSKLVPEAKRRLLQVQEVLAEREYRIGRFYFLRESWPAAIARLKSVTDAYPLYSRADDALFMLGNAYEKEIELIKAARMAEGPRSKLLADFTNSAMQAYSKIVSRYPIMPRVEDAKQRLQALHHPVPTPTLAAIAQNQAELESRSETGKFGRIMLNFKRNPDMAQAAKVGEPTMVDPAPTNAPEILRNAQQKMTEGAIGTSSVSVEQVGQGTPDTNQATPRSEAATPSAEKPSTDNAGGEAPATPPAQVNEAPSDLQAAQQAAQANDKASKKQQSSSRKKKKSVLRKLIPF